MKKLLQLKTMLLLCALIVGSGSVWADSKPWSGSDPSTTLDLATITSSTMGTWNGTISWSLSDDYLVVSGYESFKSVSTQTWITQASVNNSGSSWDALDPFKGSSYYTNANYATIQSGRYLLYKVTNLKSFKVYGKNNATSKYLDIFVYTKSGSVYTKVEEIKYTADNNNHVWENSETLDPAETYFIYITGVGSSNSRVFEVAFERNVTVIKHTLSSAVSPVSAGTVTLGATSVGEGSTTTITATPSDGYRFVSWTVTGEGSDVTNKTSASTTFTMGTADATVTANFEVIPTYSLSSVVSPAGAGTVVLGSSTVREGATTTAKASANSGYRFTGWSISGTGATLSSLTTNPTTVTMGTDDATVTATFEEVTTYAIRYSVNGVVIDTQNVPENDDVDLSAPESGIPSGYVFKGWSATEILTPQATETGISYVTSATSTKDITYYCVIAKEEGGEDTATLTASHTTNTVGYDDHEYTDDKGYTWSGFNNEPYDGDPKVARYGLNSSASGGTPYFESPTFPGNVSSITIGAYNAAGSDRTCNLNSSNDDGKNNHDLGTISIASNTKTYPDVDASLSGTSFKKFYIRASAAIGFSYISVTYNSTTYSNYCTTVTETYTVSTNTDRYYGSYVTAKKLDFKNAEGITAYIAKGFNNSKNAIVLQEVDVVPAGEAIIVKTDVKGGSADVEVTTDDASDVSENALVAGDGTTAWNGTVGYTYYYLASDQFHKAINGTLQSGKAYLKVATDDVPEARSFGFVFDDEEATGINIVAKDAENGQFFNLAGQRVAQPTKGLYIVNGRKVIVK